MCRKSEHSMMDGALCVDGWDAAFLSAGEPYNTRTHRYEYKVRMCECAACSYVGHSPLSHSATATKGKRLASSWRWDNDNKPQRRRTRKRARGAKEGTLCERAWEEEEVEAPSFKKALSLSGQGPFLVLLCWAGRLHQSCSKVFFPSSVRRENEREGSRWSSESLFSESLRSLRRIGGAFSPSSSLKGSYLLSLSFPLAAD